MSSKLYSWLDISKWTKLLLFILIIGACISFIQGLNNAIPKEKGSQDFQWSPSKLLLEKQNPYKAALNKSKDQFILAQYPNYPASGYILLWPYATLQWENAKIFWALSNVIFTIIILICIIKLLPESFPKKYQILLATLFLMSTPWRNGVGNGQHALFALSFFLLGVIIDKSDRRFSGIPLGISWFKYSVTFPLTLYFTRSKRGWLNICIASVLNIALLFFAALWANSNILDLLIGPLKVAQSYTGTGYIDVFAISSLLNINSKLIPVSISIFILLISYISIRKETDTLSSLSTLSLAAMVIVFHGYYDFVILILPLAFALSERGRSLRSKLYLIVVISIWFIDKIIYVINTHESLESLVFITSYYFGLKVLFLYGTLCTDWIILIKKHYKNLPHN